MQLDAAPRAMVASSNAVVEILVIEVRMSCISEKAEARGRDVTGRSRPDRKQVSREGERESATFEKGGRR